MGNNLINPRETIHYGVYTYAWKEAIIKFFFLPQRTWRKLEDIFFMNAGIEPVWRGYVGSNCNFRPQAELKSKMILSNKPIGFVIISSLKARGSAIIQQFILTALGEHFISADCTVAKLAPLPL